jgi:hypothetical protein
MNHLSRPLAFVAVFALAPLVACPATTPAPTMPAVADSSSASVVASVSASAAAPSVSASASTSGSTSVWSLPRGAVSASVFSDDACAADDECAPLATCHPNKCVAVAHRGALAHGTMCTEICMPGSVDCGMNHCACAASPKGAKVCALVGGPKP